MLLPVSPLPVHAVSVLIVAPSLISSSPCGTPRVSEVVLSVLLGRPKLSQVRSPSSISSCAGKQDAPFASSGTASAVSLESSSSGSVSQSSSLLSGNGIATTKSESGVTAAFLVKIPLGALIRRLPFKTLRGPPCLSPFSGRTGFCTLASSVSTEESASSRVRSPRPVASRRRFRAPASFPIPMPSIFGARFTVSSGGGSGWFQILLRRPVSTAA